MADIEITKKEIENKLFAFIEENFSKKRYECFNEVVNFVEDKIVPTLSHYDEDVDGYMNDLEIENEELESAVETLNDAFNSLKTDCLDGLESIESDLENIIENNELDSTLDKLKELKKVVEYQRRTVENADCYWGFVWLSGKLLENDLRLLRIEENKDEH